MTLRISKRFAFSASHQLEDLPPGHRCTRLHGHNYAVEVELSADRSELTGSGLVSDHGDLVGFQDWLDEWLDHRHLNDVVKDQNPSAENLAVWIYERWSVVYPELAAIRVSETPDTWVEYRP